MNAMLDNRKQYCPVYQQKNWTDGITKGLFLLFFYYAGSLKEFNCIYNFMLTHLSPF